MTEIVLRPATRDDIAVIADFNAAMARETEDKTLDPLTVRAGISAVFDDPGRGFYRVAEIDDEVVACMLVTYEWSDWRNGMWWWLQSVYVRSDHRGRGVFSAMYGNLRAGATATPGVCGLRLYVEKGNTRAQRVYTRLGMRREPYVIFHDSFSIVDRQMS